MTEQEWRDWPTVVRDATLCGPSRCDLCRAILGANEILVAARKYAALADFDATDLDLHPDADVATIQQRRNDAHEKLLAAVGEPKEAGR